MSKRLGPIRITDKEGNPVDLNEHPLLHTALGQVGRLWARCEKKFMDAMDGSKRKQVQVNFAVILNTKESMPVVDTAISFKDGCKESGMDVIKTFKLSETEELEDESQPRLPGIDPNAAPADQPTEGGGEGEAPKDGAATEGKKRSRKKK